MGVVGRRLGRYVLTMADFVTETTVRRSLGDVYAGERVTHAVMGIMYGATIALLVPTLSTWWQQPTRHYASHRPLSRRPCVGSSSSWPWAYSSQGCATCTPLRGCRTVTGRGSRTVWYEPEPCTNRRWRHEAPALALTA